MNQEWQNLLRRCVKPDIALRTSAFLLGTIAGKVRNKFASPLAKYPPAVLRAFESQSAGSRPRKSIGHNNNHDAALVDGNDKLKLASGYYSFTGRPYWTKPFDDIEQTVSLHRWGWLLIALTESASTVNRDWGLGLMRDWLRQMSKGLDGPAWESYTIGERICNAVLFMTLSSQRNESVAELPPDLHDSLSAMAQTLAARLEYNEPEWTGNHVINNARALYFAGNALHNKYFSDLAVSILRNELSRFVSDDGFLREGSSHYQFLVTRWLLEMIWLARLIGDREVSELVETPAKLMVERCWFFLVFNQGANSWGMPLIGDVSPDFSWQWLLDLPWSNLALSLYRPKDLPCPPKSKGWSSLFGISGSEKLESRLVNANVGLERFEAGGWYRLNRGSLTVFWHVEPKGTPPFVSHGHCDIGSFCLFWNGEEIMTDPGRLNYVTEDLLGRYGSSARAHNSVVIDGFEPFLYEQRNRFPPFYRQGEVEVICEESADHFQLRLRHTGFSRLHGDAIVFVRTFRVTDNQFVIEDQIEGRSHHLLETYFQLAPSVQIDALRDSIFGITSEADRFQGTFEVNTDAQLRIAHKVLRGASAPVPAGWYFPGYGEKVETSTLSFSVRTTLPYRCEYSLSWDC